MQLHPRKRGMNRADLNLPNKLIVSLKKRNRTDTAESHASLGETEKGRDIEIQAPGT